MISLATSVLRLLCRTDNQRPVLRNREIENLFGAWFVWLRLVKLNHDGRIAREVSGSNPAPVVDCLSGKGGEVLRLRSPAARVKNLVDERR